MDIENLIREFEQSDPKNAPDWILAMREYYAKHGLFRPEDLRRLLGDPNQRCDIGPNSSVCSFMNQ